MEETVLKIAFVVIGLIIGSFLNVVICRLPLEKSIVKPGSHCPNCLTPVKAYDNIPVLSYILLLGKCRQCKTKISLQYPAVEIFTAFTFWLVYISWAPLHVHVVFSAIFLCLLIALALIDYQHMMLPLELSIGGAVLFLIYSFFNPLHSPAPLDAFLSATGAALFFAFIYVFYLKVRKIEGLGQGDIWMMLLLGSFLGVNKLIVAILLASFAGSIVGIFVMITKKKNLQTQLPFGTFLSFGAYVSFFWGIEILTFIQSLYR